MEKYSLQFRDRPVQSVLQRGESKFVQLSLEPGEGITKHRAPLALTVVVLTGHVLFTVDDKTEILESSDMLALAPGVEHAVKAVEKSTVLLILTPLNDTVEAKPTENQTLEHENAYQRPDLIEQIAPELRPLVEDHIHVCKVLESVEQSSDIDTIRVALWTIERELKSHFIAEEKVLFPRMASHVGGMDVGPVARLVQEHQNIRNLHAEAEKLMPSLEQEGDEHVRLILRNKVAELSKMLLNHLGKEDSHLFPMASRLLTLEEKAAIASELKEYETTTS